jgi:hypothetical protein
MQCFEAVELADNRGRGFVPKMHILKLVNKHQNSVRHLGSFSHFPSFGTTTSICPIVGKVDQVARRLGTGVLKNNSRCTFGLALDCPSARRYMAVAYAVASPNPRIELL